MPLAWVPYPDRAESERRLNGIPAGLELDFYRADGDELPGSLDEVAFYVLPYMTGPAVRDRAARHQHGRARASARPGQRPAPGRVRPQPAQRHVAVRLRPGPGRPAGPDHRVRAHRAGDRVPAERVRGRLDHPGGPA